MTSKFQVIHMSFAKVYKVKSEQHRPFREYGLLSQWMKLSGEAREEYRV